jgi:tetratricopeptide (TPR) repeat protein
VINPLLFKRAAMAGAVVFLSLTPALAAQAPTPQELAHDSVLGSYLAARHAGIERDSESAAAYYLNVLKTDPRNADLLGRAFLSVLTEGDIDEAARLADRLVQLDRGDRVAHLVIGARALKLKQYGLARQNFAQSVRGPVTDLTATLLTAWAFYGGGNTRDALDALDRLTGPEWYAIFKDLNAGMILDLAGNKKEAAKRFERAYKADPTALRSVQAYGHFLSHAVGKDEALAIYQEFSKAVPNHPVAVDEIKELNAGAKLPPLAENPQQGGAEALYSLGASIGRRGGEDLALIYLQLSLYLEPSNSMAMLSLADLYESLKKPELAIKIYDRIPPSSPLRRNADIQVASDLDTLDRADEAKSRLEHLLAEHPHDLEAAVALANILRGRKEFAAAAEAYGKAIGELPRPEKANWVLFYFRGICYERSKQWPKAEADLKKALELYPDQPLVLNYLGYSWIDQGTHMDEGIDMIRRAVEQRPDDGYIVDSLGWANYKLGNYDEAVKNLERAVELKPDDPTINDHLGDAYWKVGRTLEARFQWSHAKDLNPEPEDLPKIEAKLKTGQPDDTSSAADVAKPKKAGNGG